MESEDFYSTTFQLLSNPDELDFEFEKVDHGLYKTKASLTKLLPAEDNNLIRIVQEKIPDQLYKGGPEPVLNGEFKIIQPNKEGNRLIDVKIGTFKCQRCGDEMYIPQTGGRFIEPFECFNEGCKRKGPFTPLFPRELIKPIWKLPTDAIECNSMQLYHEILEYIQEYLVLKSDEYHLMTLWIMSTYLVDDFNTVPYLLFIAPKESGKTQALSIIGQLGYRAFQAISVTPPALFRAIEMWNITLLVDEAEHQIKSDTETGDALYSCLNGGYKRGSFALRTEGDNRIPTPFDVFGFKAIASTKIFLPTLESRSIIFNMTQGKPKKIQLDEAQATILRSKLLYFRYKHLGKLKLKQPESTSGRLIEMFSPLYTVAQILERMAGIRTLISYEGINIILNNKIKELESVRKDEEHESNEAIIIEAIRDLRYDNTRDEPEKIRVKEIAKILGWYNDQDEKSSKESSAKIGRTLKAMGISTHRVSKGFVIDLSKPEIVKRIDEMTKRYLEN